MFLLLWQLIGVDMKKPYDTKINTNGIELKKKKKTNNHKTRSPPSKHLK